MSSRYARGSVALPLCSSPSLPASPAPPLPLELFEGLRGRSAPSSPRSATLCSSPEFTALRSRASAGLRLQNPRASTHCPTRSRRGFMASRACAFRGGAQHRALAAGMRLVVTVDLRRGAQLHRAFDARGRHTVPVPIAAAAACSLHRGLLIKVSPAFGCGQGPSGIATRGKLRDFGSLTWPLHGSTTTNDAAAAVGAARGVAGAMLCRVL
eukprot:14897847-Alexandrium_andersonii.AAC.1